MQMLKSGNNYPILQQRIGQNQYFPHPRWLSRLALVRTENGAARKDSHSGIHLLSVVIYMFL